MTDEAALPPSRRVNRQEHVAPTGWNALRAWRMSGLPPGLGTFEWLAAASARMPGASAAALIVTWTALIFSLWVGVFSALGSVLVLLLGVGVSGHAVGVLSFTSHTGTSLDLLAVLAALFGGFWLGFVHSYAVSLTSGVTAVAAALLAGIVIGFVIALVAMVGEPRILRWKGYRRPSHSEWNTHIESAVETVRDAMQPPLAELPTILIADTHIPLAWTVTRHVVLSTGLIETLEPAELAAILAHEIAHWSRGDPIALRMVWAFSWPIVLLYNVGMLLSGVSFGAGTQKNPIELGGKGKASILSFVGWFFLWPSYVLIRFVVGPTTAAGTRQMEFDADKATAQAGMQGPLVRALHRLSAFEPARSAWEAVLSVSHPPTALRIEAVEELDPDAELAPAPGVERMTRHQLRTMLVVVVFLLAIALSPLVPTHHVAHTSWWNPFQGL
ncbi:MAG: M48 family metalloprotease [Acidimicrobiales bacterium]